MKDNIYMNIVNEISKSSNCISRKVGAVIVKDDRILTTGYNGTPKGFVNCSDFWNSEYTKDHHEWSKIHEIHAEMNAIIWAARKGISIEGGTLYCTTEPCSECSKNLIASGIKRIVFRDKYPYNRENEEYIDNMLNTCSVVKEQFKKEE